MAVRWNWNREAFEQLRNDPALIGAMEAAANAAAAGTGFQVKVVTWRHAGRRSGGRTSVQIWGDGHASGEPEEMHGVLARTGIEVRVKQGAAARLARRTTVKKSSRS